MRTSTSERMSRLYAREAPVYDLTRPALLFGRRKLREALALSPGERVLDIGCGTGSALPALAAAVGPDGFVVGVDCATPLVARAARRAARLPNVEVRAAEFLGIAWGDERFDAVCFSYSLTMMPDRAEALSRALELIAPGGRLGVADFDSRPLGPLGWAFEAHGVAFDPGVRPLLARIAATRALHRGRAWGGLWRWFVWVGEPKVLPLDTSPP